MRTKLVLKAGERRPARYNPGCKTVRIHCGNARRPDRVDRKLRQRRDVGLPGSWIVREILVWRELGGIDENRNHDAVGPAPGEANQREMAFVQRPHGWNQRHSLALAADTRNPGA